MANSTQKSRTTNNIFFNPENGTTQIRKPQYLIPEAIKISNFAPEHPLYPGLEFLRQFFDATCKKDVRKYIEEYIKHHF